MGEDQPETPDIGFLSGVFLLDDCVGIGCAAIQRVVHVCVRLISNLLGHDSHAESACGCSVV